MCRYTSVSTSRRRCSRRLFERCLPIAEFQFDGVERPDRGWRHCRNHARRRRRREVAVFEQPLDVCPVRRVVCVFPVRDDFLPPFRAVLVDVPPHFEPLERVVAATPSRSSSRAGRLRRRQARSTRGRCDTRSSGVEPRGRPARCRDARQSPHGRPLASPCSQRRSRAPSVVGQWSIERVTLRVQHDELRAASGLSKPVVEVRTSTEASLSTPRTLPVCPSKQGCHESRSVGVGPRRRRSRGRPAPAASSFAASESGRKNVSTAALAPSGLVERLVAVRTPMVDRLADGDLDEERRRR